ncbi:CYCLIN domain-containing protein [Mycena indigotica]|uniref:CYCLIN domain-containing protein n=1 Tax=Mycena indigotica TaxID=2126181 RepID=A0A8H6SWJ4_9AGAR|nr:CYCLIN domain-containing protein [Mycena indigotica]KAF7306741.1 CYCLIN domain-containing protein [Mycena indigotica]
MIPLYEASSQFHNWRFSAQNLDQIRSSLNAAAVGVIRNTFEADQPGSSASISFLNPDEELLLVRLYASKIPQLCGFFRFPEEVEATAVSYLKRFYLKNTVMDWHPKNVMLTALFLATKTTNHPIALDAYANNIPKTTPSDVVDLEFLVAQSLGFEFAVWHAHRALWGIWLDLQSLPDAPPDRATSQRDVYEAALKHVRSSRLSDAELIYTPSQIALAALSIADPELASEWSHSKFPSESASIPHLDNTLAAIRALIEAAANPQDVEVVRAVDLRLKICKNPEKVVGSKAYLAKKAEEERKAEEKRTRKAADAPPTEGDPFGDELAGRLVDYDDDDDD